MNPNFNSLYNFYCAMMTIKGSLCLSSEHTHVKVVFGRKKLSSQNRSPKWQFSAKWGSRY